MSNPEREPEFRGTLIELNYIGGFGKEAAEKILGLLDKTRMKAEYWPANLGPDQDFIFYKGQLPQEIRSKLADFPDVAYIWDDPGTKAWVETVTILNNSTESS